MKRIIGLAAAITVAGCTTFTDVMPVGNNTYMVGSRTMGGMKSWVEVNAEIHKKANEYCESQGKSANILSKGTAGVRGWSPMESDVTFECAPK